MLTKKQLHNELFYDRSTGEFFRIKTKGIQFKDSPAGSIGSGGYVKITVNGISYMAHHLVMVYEYGLHTDLIIDHIDGNPSNNKSENLRCVSHKDNMKNKSLNVKNKSGINGVRLINGVYHLWVGVNYIGKSTSKAKIKSMADKGFLSAGYHKNHGQRKPVDINSIKRDFWNRGTHCHFGNYENINKLNKVRGRRA